MSWDSLAHKKTFTREPHLPRAYICCGALLPTSDSENITSGQERCQIRIVSLVRLHFFQVSSKVSQLQQVMKARRFSKEKVSYPLAYVIKILFFLIMLQLLLWKTGLLKKDGEKRCRTKDILSWTKKRTKMQFDQHTQGANTCYWALRMEGSPQITST